MQKKVSFKYTRSSKGVGFTWVEQLQFLWETKGLCSSQSVIEANQKIVEKMSSPKHTLHMSYTIKLKLETRTIKISTSSIWKFFLQKVEDLRRDSCVFYLFNPL